jgi:Tfp pilus assembly protein PilO
VKRGPVVAALVGAGVIVLLVVGLILPKAAQVRNRQSDTAAAKSQESALRVELAQLDQAALEAGDDREDLAGLEALVPPTADLPGLIRLINTAAAESKVSFLSMSPGSPSPSTGISAIPTTITITGGYFSVDQFLYRLETLPRISKVTALAINPAGIDGEMLQAVLTAQFFTTDGSAGPGSVPGPSDPALSDLFDEALAGSPQGADAGDSDSGGQD